MRQHHLLGLLCLGLVGAAAWVGRTNEEAPTTAPWIEVSPGVLRSPGLPAGYALVSGDAALLIDAPCGPEGLKAHGVKKVETVLLTHHHRDSAVFAGRYLADKAVVRAPKASAELLTPAGVRTYWKESLPLRGSSTSYLVLAEGIAGVDCSLEDAQTIDWKGWNIRVVATPGHSRDHVAYAVNKANRLRELPGPLLLFCGDALAEPQKLWTPYTTDWDHWTDLGLKPTAESLRKLAALKPDVLLPAHGAVLDKNCADVLTKTADAVQEVAFLKSFERFTKQRLKDEPKYAFLTKEQAESNGSKPWSRVSEHLWLTGNTYVLLSKDNACLVMDPWDPHSAKQLPKLKEDQKLGPMEVALCSHAHFDHYDGIYSLFEREKCQVWTLDRVAVPVADPFLLRAPFLDARPLKIDRRFKDGETATWREYRLRFRHLPGQTEFTMGVETVIDGKRCFFTADNFFHQDQFSGSGGWMGMNRSWPLAYAESAQKVLDAAPEWVLAEHGGPFEFNAEDFRRRVQWGKVGAQAADALSPSGNHLRDWNPHLVHVEPLIHKAKAGQTLKATLVAGNPLARAQKLSATLEGRGLTPDQTWEVTVPAGETVRKEVAVRLGEKMAEGRHVFVLRVLEGDRVDPSDAFIVADVEP